VAEAHVSTGDTMTNQKSSNRSVTMPFDLAETLEYFLVSGDVDSNVTLQRLRKVLGQPSEQSIGLMSESCASYDVIREQQRQILVEGYRPESGFEIVLDKIDHICEKFELEGLHASPTYKQFKRLFSELKGAAEIADPIAKVAGDAETDVLSLFEKMIGTKPQIFAVKGLAFQVTKADVMAFAKGYSANLQAQIKALAQTNATAMALLECQHQDALFRLDQINTLQSELAELEIIKAFATIPLRERCNERKHLQAEVERLRDELSKVTDMGGKDTTGSSVIARDNHELKSTLSKARALSARLSTNGACRGTVVNTEALSQLRNILDGQSVPVVTNETREEAITRHFGHFGDGE
jgi:hypothetical protein